MRLRSIDILKLLTMFLVIWGHCVQFLLSSHYLDEPAYIYIYSFHMPLFMIISGLFVKRFSLSASVQSVSSVGAKSPSVGACFSYLLVKARQLLLPCVAWGLLMSAANQLQPLLTGTDAGMPLWRTLWMNFWFLKSLFVCFLLWVVSHMICCRTWLAVILSLGASLFITEWSVQWMYPMFVIGAIVGGRLDAFRRVSLPVAIGCLLIGAVMLVWWIASCFRIPSVYALLDGSADNIAHALLMRLYKYLVNASLSLGLIALFLHLDDLTPSVQSVSSVGEKSSSVGEKSVLSVLAGWGRLTLGIYIVHSLMFIVRERLFPSLLCCDALNPWLFNIAIAPLVAAVLLVISVGITSFLTRLPYLSFFLLGTPWPAKSSRRS